MTQSYLRYQSKWLEKKASSASFDNNEVLCSPASESYKNNSLIVSVSSNKMITTNVPDPSEDLMSEAIESHFSSPLATSTPFGRRFMKRNTVEEGNHEEFWTNSFDMESDHSLCDLSLLDCM